MEDRMTELYKTHRESLTRYTYFLLAAAGAMIGLAVQQTSGLVLETSQLPLALAVVCWGLSFYFGCMHVAYVNSNLYTNLSINSAVDGTHPSLKDKSASYVHAAIEGMHNAFEYNANKANGFGNWQFRFLILGAICYLAWHVLQMYIRTI
jgi:hypothetical protein